MTLKEIVEKCSGLPIHEERLTTAERCELVVYNKEIADWCNILTDILGPPRKPTGVAPSKDDQQLAKDYGGIFKNQILFKKDYDDYFIIAMFWPWQDQTHTTLKLVLKRTATANEV